MGKCRDLGVGGVVPEPQLRKREAGKDGGLGTCLVGHPFLLLKRVRYMIAACI